MKLSIRGIAELKRLEGFRAEAYIPIPGDVPTIGYGFTKGVKLGDTITEDQAHARLLRELEVYEIAVETALTVPANQNQFDSFVIFCFNIGITGFAKSTVVKAHNRGDTAAAARAFALWNKSGGRVIPGLVRRRAMESALYLEPMPGEAWPALGTIDPPQTIDPPNTMTGSSMNRASAIGAGTAALAAGADVANTVTGFKSSLEGLGTWLVPVLLGITICACAWLVWERVKLRKEGRL